MMQLTVPTMAWERQIQAFRREYLASGESMDGGASLRKYESTEAWLSQISDLTSQYIFVREGDRKMVGIIQIRQRFNDYLKTYAGHIGYSVLPSERRKGYATQMLSLALEECRRLGLLDVLVCCIEENEGSRRTILKCGGKFEKKVFEPDMQVWIERYWIHLEPEMETEA
ncbi:MAG: GNAT family N-acetyltransferase [Clostridia bacterium]|nr:GNAT family N-acetyltransferase [Clostridia bacterium]